MSDDAKVNATFEGVASSLVAAGKILKDPAPVEGCDAETIQTAAGVNVLSEISDLKDGLLALTTRVVELESKNQNTISRARSAKTPKKPSSGTTIPSGPIQLGSNYLGNTLSEIRLNSKVLGKLVTGLQAYYSITLSNLVHNKETGEVTFDAQRSREGFEWSECKHLNLSQVLYCHITRFF